MGLKNESFGCVTLKEKNGLGYSFIHYMLVPNKRTSIQDSLRAVRTMERPIHSGEICLFYVLVQVARISAAQSCAKPRNETPGSEQHGSVLDV